jgi:uncharacterized membrane protein HdeD (DUF308 family)
VTTTIIISILMVAGVLLMFGAIFAKNKDLEKIRLYSADFLEHILNILFSISSVQTKRILLFLIGFLWTGFFVYMILASE